MTPYIYHRCAACQASSKGEGEAPSRLEDGNFRLLGACEELIVMDNYWIRPATGQAGNVIDFFVKIRGMRFDSVMRLLLPT